MSDLLDQIQRSYLEHLNNFICANDDLEAIEGLLETIGTATLVGVTFTLPESFRATVERLVPTWGFLHLGEAAFDALDACGGHRLLALDVRDRVELFIVAARVVLGRDRLSDEALSSIDAFDALVGPMLTEEERAFTAWMSPDKRARSWRADGLV
jgi:hypothetical protein